MFLTRVSDQLRRLLCMEEDQRNLKEGKCASYVYLKSAVVPVLRRVSNSLRRSWLYQEFTTLLLLVEYAAFDC